MMRFKYPILAVFILAFSLVRAVAADDEVSPYEDVQQGKQDKTQSMLSIALDSGKQQGTSKKIKLKIRIFNNSDATIYVVEQNVHVDFHFQVTDSSGKTVNSNQEFAKIKQNRMAWLHISQEFKPGAYRIYDVNLSKIYDLTPGQTYTVQAWRYVSNQEYGPPTQVTSNTLQFVVPQ